MKIRSRAERRIEPEYTMEDLFRNIAKPYAPSDDNMVFFHYMIWPKRQKYPWFNKGGYGSYNDAVVAMDEEFTRMARGRIASKFTVQIIKGAMEILKHKIPSKYSGMGFDEFLNPEDETEIDFRRETLEIACDGGGGTLSSSDYYYNNFSNLFFGKYGEELNHLYEAMIADYNPVENYNMVEEETTNTGGTKDITNSQDTTNKTEYGKVIDNDRATTETVNVSEVSSRKNTGTDTTDIKTDNTQTSDGNTTRKGTVTETRDLKTAEEGKDNNTQTDDLTEAVTLTNNELRTEDLTEKNDITDTDIRTDDLTETNEATKNDTRTDTLKEVLSETDDNNKTVNNTETRTDALKEVETKDGTNTKTNDLQHKTIYNSTETETSDLDVSGSRDNTRTDDLTEATGGDRNTKYGKEEKTDRGRDLTTAVNEGGTVTVTNNYQKVYSETTVDKNTDDKGESYKELVGNTEGADPYVEKKIISGAYEETETYSHKRSEPQDRSYSEKRQTTGESHTKTERENKTSAYDSMEYQPLEKMINDETVDKYPTETMEHTAAEGEYVTTDETTPGTKDTKRTNYSLTDGNGGVENYKETNEHLGVRLELKGGKTQEILHIDGDRELQIPSKDEEKTNKELLTKTTEGGTDYEYSKNSGTDTETYGEKKTNTGTVKDNEIISRTEDSRKQIAHTGDDTATDTGTETIAENGTVTTDNTGTQTTKIEGHEDDLHTIESTKDNTGTVTNEGSENATRKNTGTVRDEKTEAATKKNTGTEETATTGEQTKKNTGTITNARTTSGNGTETGTISTENNLTDTAVQTVTDDGTQKNTRTLDLSEAGTNTEDTTSSGTDKLKITASGEDNVTENITGKSKEVTDEDITRMLTRKGNIGVTTTQQMILESINLYSQFSFTEIVAKLATNMLTLDVY